MNEEEYLQRSQPYNAVLNMVAAEIELINQRLKDLNGYYPVEYVKKRIKSYKSFSEKAQKYDIDTNLFDVIRDIAGIRVICDTIDDVYMLANQIKASSNFEVVAIKDYIEKPKKSGYRSYHIIINYLDKYVEIQIRTMAMDNWASIEHKWNYKYNNKLSKKQLKELKEMAQLAYLMDQKYSEINPYIQ